MATEVKKPREWLRIAADLKWRDHRLRWGEIAKRVGVDESTMSRARQTEEWEIVFRDAGNERVEALAPAALEGLLIAWAMGKATGAIDVLRATRFLPDEQVKVEHTFSEEDLDRELTRLLALSARAAEASHAGKTNGVAANGASGPAKL